MSLLQTLSVCSTQSSSHSSNSSCIQVANYATAPNGIRHLCTKSIMAGIPAVTLKKIYLMYLNTTQ
jgi:hypothetical protein